MQETCVSAERDGRLALCAAAEAACAPAAVLNQEGFMRVLVVEDEPDLLAVLSQSLREDGYAVDTAADGREGFLKAKGGQGQYDALVLDLMLPRMDGWTVLKELRKGGDAVPVLILTARDALSDRVRGLDSGADDYLAKPFELAELLARLRALIRRSAGKPSSLVEVGDVVIDTAAKTISKAGQPVALTAREYALVEFLAVHRGQLVSRTMIYDHLFDDDDDSLSNLVDVHVSNVRKKLGRNIIATRRGQGYMLGAAGVGGEAGGGDEEVEGDV
jgi:two-component system, OmpR family, response regulator